MVEEFFAALHESGSHVLNGKLRLSYEPSSMSNS